MDDVLLCAGGIIPSDDVEQIKGMGFDFVGGPGMDTRDFVEYINDHATARA